MESAFPDSFARYFESLRGCVLDIETSGLSRENSKVILVGLLTETDGGVKVTQFLAENHYEEYKVLAAALDYLDAENIDYLITYNGAAFDMPFIARRLEANFFDEQIRLFNYDLYRFIKSGTDLRDRLGSLSQKSVENYYGILDDREDSITGRESVVMFDEYSLTGNSTLEKIILTHNREDVLHLYRLMHTALADVHDMHKAMASHGFPAERGRLSVRPSVRKQKKLLHIAGEQIKDPISCAFFPDAEFPLTVEFNTSSSSFEIIAPVGRYEGDYYIDLGFLMSDDPDSLAEDPDYVNGYLILSPRTVNLCSSLLISHVLKKLG